MHRKVSFALALFMLLVVACASRRSAPASPAVTELSASNDAESQPINSPTVPIQAMAPLAEAARRQVSGACPPSRIVKQLVVVPKAQSSEPPPPPVAPSVVCHPTVVTQSDRQSESSELTWGDFQSLIQLGIGLNLLFGLFQAALEPVIMAGAENRRTVLRNLQRDPRAQVDAVKLTCAWETVVKCEKYARNFSRIGAYPSIIFSLAGIALLILASERAQMAIPDWGRYATYIVALLWPIVAIFTLGILIVRADSAVRKVKIGK